MTQADLDQVTVGGRRPRNAEATRKALLGAACIQFAHRGFEGTSMRDVARDAGVDQALVYRYFGSKAALYEEVHRSYAKHYDALFNTDDENFAAIMIAHLIEKPSSVRIEPLLGLLRGPHPEGSTAALTMPRLLHDFVARLADKAARQPGVSPDDARLRAALIGALTVGIPIMRDVVGEESLATASPEHVASLYAEAIRALLQYPAAAERTEPE
ncbi:MAG TPA: TetR family transcriptional regulator [Streptosporangiaceae bacterium]|nr:TetR family transcriptional regulator [Streptosporangiaceae bacterium]